MNLPLVVNPKSKIKASDTHTYMQCEIQRQRAGASPGFPELYKCGGGCTHGIAQQREQADTAQLRLSPTAIP